MSGHPKVMFGKEQLQHDVTYVVTLPYIAYNVLAPLSYQLLLASGSNKETFNITIQDLDSQTKKVHGDSFTMQQCAIFHLAGVFIVYVFEKENGTEWQD